MQNEMTATRMALEDVGWTDQSPNGLEQIDKTPVIPEHVHNGLKWKALVEEKNKKFWQKETNIYLQNQTLE